MLAREKWLPKLGVSCVPAMLDPFLGWVLDPMDCAACELKVEAHIWCQHLVVKDFHVRRARSRPPVGSHLFLEAGFVYEGVLCLSRL